jgi:hypothetical protein
MTTLNTRRAAIRAASEKFEGKPLVWGEADCARLVSAALAAMGIKPALSRFGAYSSAATALRRLRAQGLDSVPEWLDGVDGCKRSEAFACALPGDIIAGPSGDDRFPALGVFLGGDKYLGFDPVAPHACRVLQMLAAPLYYWSVTPCLKQ